MTKMRICKYIFATTFFAIALAGGTVQAEEFAYDYQKVVPLERPVEFSLELTRGHITVTGSESDDLIIEATKIVRASNRREAEEMADHVEIKVNTSKNKVSVETNYLTMLSRSPSFWQKVLGGGSANLVIVNYIIRLPFGSSVAINSMAADIDLANIEGAVTVDNNTGTTRGEFLFGPITVRQPTGNIDLRWVEGDIRIKSTSGKIYINQVRGAVDLNTQTGNVTIQTELDSPRDHYVETLSGTINFLIPSSASGVLKIETETGVIKSEMPIAIETMNRKKVVGMFGAGGSDISLLSTSGDVTVSLF